MYFSKASVFRFTCDVVVDDVQLLSEKLAELQFVECGALNMRRVGFVSPLHAFDSEDMVLSGDGRVLIALKSEQKILPVSSVKKLLDKKVKEVESTESRKVGKKERATFRDEVIHDLLPRCLTTETYLYGYLSLKHGLLVIDSVSNTAIDEFCAFLRSALGSLPIVPIEGVAHPGAVMTSWLQEQKPPSGFVIGDSAKLVHFELGKVALKEQDLFADEVLEHLGAGKQVEEVRLEKEGVLGFTLTDDLRLKQLKWNGEFVAKTDDVECELSRADADFALMAGGLDSVLLGLFNVVRVEGKQLCQ